MKLPTTLTFGLTFGLCLSSLAPASNIDGNHIRAASDMSPQHIQLLAQDFSYLRSLALKVPDAEMASIMSLPSQVSAQDMSKWLRARVQYIVSDAFKLDEDTIFEMQRGYPYPKAEEKPRMEKPLQKTTANPQSEGPRMIMANLGSIVYVAGKKLETLLALKIPGVEDLVEITSPRVGVIQVSPALFRGLFGKASKNLASPAHSIHRLATIFHEARHSDGSGKSLGFMHATCPEGHDYAGYAACDRNLNGPYTIGFLTFRWLLQACTDCDPAEKEALRLFAIDSQNRVIKETVRIDPENPSRLKIVPSERWDASPEGQR